ncbi:hypothetical protein I5P78_26010 [Serratia marcescens]|nr:hypothetical protein [Serratia marcescens]
MIDSFKWSNENGYVKIEELISSPCVMCGDGGTQACNINYNDKKSKCTIALGHDSPFFPLISIVDADGSVYPASSQLNTWSGKLTTYKVPKNNRVCLLQMKANGVSSMPHGVCSGGGIPPEPTPAVCSASNVVLEHGALSSSSLDGSTIKNNVNVECNQSTMIHLSLSGYNGSLGLKLAEGLYSKIMIGGKSGDVGVNVLVTNSTSIEIISKLSASGSIDAGDYSGVVVMALDII